jgi:hypothetical protein
MWLILDEVSRNIKTGEANPILRRSRESLGGGGLYGETAVTATVEFVTMQHPDGNAERDVHSEEEDS